MNYLALAILFGGAIIYFLAIIGLISLSDRFEKRVKTGRYIIKVWSVFAFIISIAMFQFAIN